MKLLLEFDNHPYSVNDTHYSSGRRKTAYRKWTEEIQFEMLRYSKQLSGFNAAVCDKTHGLTAKIEHFMPFTKFFRGRKSDEGISLQSKDLTNVEKPLIDAIFSSKYNGRNFKYVKSKQKVQTLNLDDKLLVDCLSFKRPFPDKKLNFLIRVELNIISLDEL